MATSVHIPKPLLEAVDRRAHTLRISRNRLIVKALERELAEGDEWSAEFFERLRAVDQAAAAAAVDDMLAAVRARRRSKEPRLL
jgi:predicted transcriptional regulator